MKFWLDTEFAEDGRTIDLISIGIVAENGREFYYQNANANLHRANPWVVANVVPRLLSCPANIPAKAHMSAPCGVSNCSWKPKYWIKRELLEWIGLLSKPDGFTWQKPEFWGYYADYDWVAVCQLFGRMVDLPAGWPMYCRDLKQWCDDLGNPDLAWIDGKNEHNTNEHNALADAWWNKHAYDHLMYLQGRRYREMLNAGTRDKQEVPSREISEESGHVRGVEKTGQNQVRSGGDQQRATQQDRKTRKAQIERTLADVPPKGGS